MSSKGLKLLDTWEEASTSKKKSITNWNLCVICQEDSVESLICPLQSRRKDVRKGYQSLAENLAKFDALGKLPRSLQLSRIDEGQGKSLNCNNQGLI